MKRFGKSFFATLAATHSRSVGLARSSTCSCPSRSLAPASHLAPSPIACRILMEFGAHDKRNHDGKLPRCGGASAASGMPRELDPKDESRIPAGSTLYSPDDPEPEWRTPKQEERGGDYVPDPASKPALVNCTGDGGVLKKIIKKGDNNWKSRPPPGAVVQVRYKVALADADGSAPMATPTDQLVGKTVVEASQEPFAELSLAPAAMEEMRLVTHRGADTPRPPGVLGILLGLPQMNKREIAQLLCKPEYGYGACGCAALGVPPGKPVTVLLELVGWRYGGSAQEKFDEALALKAKCAECVAEGNWVHAGLGYMTAIEILTEKGYEAPSSAEAAALLAACRLNLAMVHLKRGHWAEAEAAASTVLETQPDSAKALFRRGTARMQLDEPRSALGDLKKAAALEPKSADVRAALAEAKEAVAELKAHERQLGSGLVARSAEEPSASSDAGAAAAPAPAPRSTGEKPAAERPAAERSAAERATAYEAERAIADARLEANRGNLVLDPEDLSVRYLKGEQMGANLERYSWGQTESEVTICVPGLSPSLRPKDCSFETTTRTLKLEVSGETILHGALFDFVISDECTYEIERQYDGRRGAKASGADESGWLFRPPEQPTSTTIYVSLVKASRTQANRHWSCVVRGEPEIDTARFGEPVVALDENSPADVAEYMQRTQLGGA